MEGVLQVFKEFEAGSGLKISLEKSTLFMAGVSPHNRERIIDSFPFDVGMLPVRYLGLPLTTKRMSLADCLPLIEKVRTRFGSWKINRFLSFAGRLQLLNSVISSLTTFWISAFRLPSACIREIEQICAAFLWSGSELNTRKAKVAWSDVCRPKQEGGLGIKPLAEANKVSCLKLIWRIVSARRSLWVNWIYEELIRSSSFWSIKATASTGSWMWRKILKYRDLARSFYKIKVKSGSLTSFWYDNWSSLGHLHEVLGNRGCIDLGIRSQATVSNVVTTHRRRNHRSTILNKIEDEIDGVRSCGVCTEDDQALWLWSNGKYKPKFSSRETWLQTRTSRQPINWYKAIWFSESTPKFAFLAWLAAQNRLTTGDRMSSWNVTVSSSCVFCREPVESRNHLFFTCSYSSKIWEVLTRLILCNRFTSDFDEVLLLLSGSVFTSTTRFILRYVFQATVHSIWRERNNRRHGELPNPPEHLIKFIDRAVRNRLSTVKKQGSPKYEDGLRLWFRSRP